MGTREVGTSTAGRRCFCLPSRPTADDAPGWCSTSFLSPHLRPLHHACCRRSHWSTVGDSVFFFQDPTNKDKWLSHWSMIDPLLVNETRISGCSEL
jgi:hypothetical protein